MLHPSDTDLRAYSGRALLVAAAISTSLHVFLALAAPEWGGGKGLPLFRRSPLVVRMEMLRERQEAEGRGQEKKNQGSGARDQGPGIRGQMSGVGKSKDRFVFPDTRNLTPETAVGFSPTPVSAGGREKGLALAAQGSEGADGLAFAGDVAAENLPFSSSPALPVGEGDVGGAEALEMWQVEEPPKQVTFVDPEYPSMARRMGVEGSVVIRYLVDQDGRVEQMKVLEGPELLREASLRAVEQFVYEPVYDRGRRTKVWMRQVITFRLE